MSDILALAKAIEKLASAIEKASVPVKYEPTQPIKVPPPEIIKVEEPKKEDKPIEFTLDQVRDVVIKLVSGGDEDRNLQIKAKIQTILAEYNVKKLTELDAKFYGEFINKLPK